MALIKLSTLCDKEVYTVKINDTYRGVVTADDAIYITEAVFSTPLQAANEARKLKRIHKISRNIKKNDNTTKKAIKTKITRAKRLYSEAEVAQITHLKFREAWVIVSPDGVYVSEVLKEETIVNYCKSKEDAQTFKTYEDACMYQKTLNLVVKNGHTLKRFFTEVK